MRKRTDVIYSEEIINCVALFEFLAALGGQDGEQLMGMARKYRSALNIDSATFATVNAGGLDNYIRDKAVILAKKLLWLNWKCKQTVGKNFLRKRINKEDIKDMLNLADEFIGYVDVSFE